MLHVLEPLEGGTPRHVVDVVRHAGEVLHEVAIPRERIGWVTDETVARLIAEAGATVHVVPMRRSPVHVDNARALSTLRRLVRERRPDIVHGHSSIGGALSRLATLGTPAARIYTAHAIRPSRPVLAAERALGRLTDYFVAVSASEGALAIARGLVPAERVRVIPNGIDLTQPAGDRNLRRELGLPAAVPLVGSISRLVPQKAPERYVQACAVAAQQVPEAHFLLVGDGPLRDRVAEEAQRPVLAGRFHHVRVVPQISEVLGQLDVFVLASRFEGGPYAPLEAMRAVTAVVLTDVVGNRDVVEHGVSGLLVPPDDAERLGRSVVQLLRDAALRSAVATAGHQRLLERFDVRTMGRALSELYRCSAGRAGRR